MPSVEDIKADDLPIFRETRGDLVVAELSNRVPFPVARLFYVQNVPVNTIRGQHAHLRCRQYMICQRGRMLIDVADGKRTRRIELNAGQAILVENGIFSSETYLERDSILLVLCDRPYDRTDYIGNMEEFLQTRAGR